MMACGSTPVAHVHRWPHIFQDVRRQVEVLEMIICVPTGDEQHDDHGDLSLG